MQIGLFIPTPCSRSCSRCSSLLDNQDKSQSNFVRILSLNSNYTHLSFVGPCYCWRWLRCISNSACKIYGWSSIYEQIRTARDFCYWFYLSGMRSKNKFNFSQIWFKVSIKKENANFTRVFLVFNSLIFSELRVSGNVVKTISMEFQMQFARKINFLQWGKIPFNVSDVHA